MEEIKNLSEVRSFISQLRIMVPERSNVIGLLNESLGVLGEIESQNKQLLETVESLKCCGNCEHYGVDDPNVKVVLIKTDYLTGKLKGRRINTMKYKPVEGFDRYLVSCKGDIVSMYGKESVVLKNQTMKTGYVQIGLKRNKKNYRKYIHRLVAKAFVLNPQNKKEVNHIDGDKSNNVASNLEWCTRAENNQHAYNMKLKVQKGYKGSKNPTAKLKESDIVDILKMISNGLTNPEIAIKYNVKKSQISKIRTGRGWRHITNRVQELEANEQ